MSGSLSFSKIKNSSDFKRIGKLGLKFYSSSFLLSFVETKDSTCFGVIASRKVGCAVKRNRCKRLIRVLIKDVFNNSIDRHVECVVVARAAMLKASYKELLGEAVFASKKILKIMQNGLGKNV